nr:TetR/AcrR family transcriptional regulator [Clostridium mobile]
MNGDSFKNKEVFFVPKIIKDIESKIFSTSMDLFLKKGYKAVDMKMIAKECGIAVGTLYNYYPNKKELYISILKESWNDTFIKLDSVLESSLLPKEKANEVINILYSDIENRQGIGKELRNDNIKDLSNDKRVTEFKETLIKKIELSISKLEKKEEFKEDKNIDMKISEIILMSIIVIIKSHKNEKVKNIKILNKTLEAFLV